MVEKIFDGISAVVKLKRKMKTVTHVYALKCYLCLCSVPTSIPLLIRWGEGEDAGHRE